MGGLAWLSLWYRGAQLPHRASGLEDIPVQHRTRAGLSRAGPHYTHYTPAATTNTFPGSIRQET